jgi:hypothetical protein
MPPDDPADLDRIDQEIRINELKEQANELAGGNMTMWESGDCPPEIEEEFWQQVVDYERGPWTSTFDKLLKAGMELPAPETMTDAELTAKLWEMIPKLAELCTFLRRTDHLSDRELYTQLWKESLHEQTGFICMEGRSVHIIDILGSCSEEDIQLQMKFYEDEERRRRWLEEFSDYQMPPHEDPPYDRDRHLPQSEF